MTRQRTNPIRFISAFILCFVALTTSLAQTIPSQLGGTPPAPVFLPTVAYSTGGYDAIFSDNSTWVSVTDVNGDGKPDILIANWCSAFVLNACPAGASVSILIGNSDGTFQPAVTYPTGGYYGFSVLTADVNGDGKLDLVVANGCLVGVSTICPSNGSVGVLLGNGNGSFRPVVTYSSGGLLSWIGVADVNGDGHPDLLVANQDGGSNGQGSAGVLLNRGDGTFLPVQTYTSGGLQADFITAADVNADGKLDLLVINFVDCNACEGSVGVLLGNGDGSFRPAVHYPALAPVSAVSVADLAGDGKLDLILTDGGSYGGGEVIVLRGNGDGTFQPAQSYGVGGAYNNPPIVADLNGDHKLDLAMSIGTCTGISSSCVGIMFGNGDGSYQPVIHYPVPVAGAGSLATGDLNGDGIPDLLVASQCGKTCVPGGGTISLLMGNGDGTFQPGVLYSSGGLNTSWVGAADLRNKGRLDVIGVSPNGNIGAASVLLNNRSSRATATSAQVASSVNPSVLGQNVTFTATIASTVGKPANGERVTFTNGMTFLGVGHLSNGVASFTTSSLQGGVSSILAIYNGDAKFSGTASPPVAEVVKATAGENPTATALTSSANPSVQGKPLKFTATVSPQQGTGTPTGKITFLDGGAILNTRSLVQGSASYSTPSLAPGQHNIRGVYLGDSNYDISTSSAVSQAVQAVTTTSLTSTPNPSTYGVSVVFTATVVSSIGTPPDGEAISFKRGATVIGSGILHGGSATFATSTLPVGTITITAAYSGDASFVGSTSKALRQVVSKGP
jgi:hypothetical protein